jgi:hypothetical protein
MEAKRAGAKIVAVSSSFWQNEMPEDHFIRHPSKTNLFDYADVCIDDFNPVGDAVVNIEGFETPIAPISNIVDFYIAHMLEIECVKECQRRGITAPCWSSANTPGGDEKNAAYLEKYSGVRDYQKSIVEQARAEGFVKTLFGRQRALPELKSSNFAMRSFGERVALNMPIQGTAADIIKLAMIRVEEALNTHYPEAKLLLQVHDELIVECPEAIAPQVAELISKQMQTVAELKVPLTAEAKYGKSWYEAK